MKYRNMGKHGLKLSEISIGTMYHGSYFSEKQSHIVLKEAINQGINFIDCADRYGIEDSNLPMEQRTPAEKVLGTFLKTQNRDDLVISSKVFKQLRKTPNNGGLSRKHIQESIRQSLGYLQTDYLDIYFCHRVDNQVPLEETIRTMTNLIDDGRVHYWGTSWAPPYIIERAIGIAKENGLISPTVEEPPYHINARFIESDLFHVADYHGLGITAFEALATGFYTGKYLDGIPEDSRGAIVEHLPQNIIDERREQILALREVASSLEIPLSQLMFAWVLRNPQISSTIMGASKPEQVIENCGASGIVLPQDALEKIEAILDNDPRKKYHYRFDQRPD